MIEDEYKTIVKSGESLFKDKGSKFYGYAFHIRKEEDLKVFIKDSIKEHHNARHHCYAFRTGLIDTYYRGNDDGEPSNTAGKPILNQLYAFELYEVALVVVRYFGGTKLGVSGLINAYKNTATLAIEDSRIESRFVTKDLKFSFDYANINRVMRVIKEHDIKIKSQESDMKMSLVLEIKLSDFEKIRLLIFQLNCVTFQT